MDRREFLRGASLTAAGVGLAGCSSGGDGTETTRITTRATPTPFDTTTAGSEYGDWFANTDNFDGTVDRTGREEVRVAVGAAGNGGNFAFEPAAVAVSAGTTVVWEWTGEGGQHNVLGQDAEIGSDLVEEAGHTFRHTFEEPRTFLYVCVPHKSLGMRGAVVVEA